MYLLKHCLFLYVFMFWCNSCFLLFISYSKLWFRFYPLVLLFELCISQCFHLVCLHYVTILVACYFYLFCNYPVVVKLFQILVINFSLTLTSVLLRYFHLEIWSFFLQETWICYPYFLSGLWNLLNRLHIFNDSLNSAIYSGSSSSDIHECH